MKKNGCVHASFAFRPLASLFDADDTAIFFAEATNNNVNHACNIKQDLVIYLIPNKPNELLRDIVIYIFINFMLFISFQIATGASWLIAEAGKREASCICMNLSLHSNVYARTPSFQYI